MKFIYALMVAGLIGASSVVAQEQSIARVEIRPRTEAAQREALRRWIINRLTISFPWGRCTILYRAKVNFPKYITGNACGTYVVCQRVGRSRRYLCRW